MSADAVCGTIACRIVFFLKNWICCPFRLVRLQVRAEKTNDSDIQHENAGEIVGKRLKIPIRVLTKWVVHGIINVSKQKQAGMFDGSGSE